MINNGYIKIHRKILDSSVFSRSTYLHVWLYVLLSVNHTKKSLIFNNKKIDVLPGQFITSRLKIADATQIAPTTVENILEYLVNEQQIGQQKTTKYRIISVINWKDYQIDGTQNGQQADNKPTTNGQQADTNKKAKNDKNEDNEKNINIYTSDFEIFWKSYPHRDSDPKKKAFDEWKKAIRVCKPDKIMEAIEGYKQSKTVKDGYQVQAHRWLKERMWEAASAEKSKFWENFDKGVKDEGR